MTDTKFTCTEIKSLIEGQYLCASCKVEDVSQAHANHYIPSESSLDHIPSHIKITIHLQSPNHISKVESHRQIYKLLDSYFKQGLHSAEIKILPLQEAH